MNEMKHGELRVGCGICRSEDGIRGFLAITRGDEVLLHGQTPQIHPSETAALGAAEALGMDLATRLAVDLHNPDALLRTRFRLQREVDGRVMPPPRPSL